MAAGGTQLNSVSVWLAAAAAAAAAAAIAVAFARPAQKWRSPRADSAHFGRLRAQPQGERVFARGRRAEWAVII